MDRKQKIRVVVIIPAVIVVLLLGAIVYSVLQTAAVSVIEPAASISSDAEAPQSAEAGLPQGAVAEEPAMNDKALACAFDFLIGLQSAVAVEQIEPLGRPYRVIGPGGMVTQDFSEERINLQTDESGKVVAVTCG